MQTNEKTTWAYDYSLYRRIVTGSILVATILLLVYFGALTFLLLLLFINVQGIREYSRLFAVQFNLQRSLMLILGSFIIIAPWLIISQHASYSLLFIFIPLLFLFFISELFRANTTPFQNIALSVLGVLWVSLPLAAFSVIAFFPLSNKAYSSGLVTGYFLILWAGDTAAYFVGKFFGKHKLFSRISPNKTIEGFFGGLVAALITGYFAGMALGGLSIQQWLILSLIINLTGVLGDLIKSMLKRSANVKDTGTLLPGHGGVLDRFDSLIGSAPFALIYLLYIYA